MANPAFFTIGHSNRSSDAFVELLRAAGTAFLIDIRTIPKSRANPQFNGDVLGETLRDSGIDYAHWAALGGLRGRDRDVPPATNAYWTNESFHNYADYALGPQFQAALQELRAEGQRRCCTIMCAEAVWWRCHRRIVADYLIASGERTFHIMGPGKIVPARLNPGAIVQADGTIHYPAA